MKPKTETTAAPLAVIGVDIGKEVFHLVGFGADGKIAFRKKIRRLNRVQFETRSYECLEWRLPYDDFPARRSSAWCCVLTMNVGARQRGICATWP
jgi:hypothetical protein